MLDFLLFWIMCYRDIEYKLPSKIPSFFFFLVRKVSNDVLGPAPALKRDGTLRPCSVQWWEIADSNKKYSVRTHI